MKVKVLTHDKDALRSDFLKKLDKVEIVVESVQTESKEKESTETENSINSDDEVEVWDNNEKKIQTITWVWRSKAVQTEESLLKLRTKINSRNRSERGNNREDSSCKTINSQISIQNTNNNNLDLIQAEDYFIPEEKYSEHNNGNNRSRKRKYTIENIEDGNNRDSTPNIHKNGMFPKLINQSRDNVSHIDGANTFMSPRTKFSQKSLLYMNPKNLAQIELSEDKTSKLNAIYNENKKSGFAKNQNNDQGISKFVQTKSSAVLKVITNLMSNFIERKFKENYKECNSKKLNNLYILSLNILI